MILTLVAALLVAAVPISAWADARSPRIVALGDSLTSGHGIGTDRAYPAVLQERLTQAGFHYAVVNSGVSRDTSAGALRRLEPALDGDVRVLIVALGANDGLRGVPIAQLRSNLAAIIGTAQARGISVILCGMETLPIHGWDYTIQFHRVYRELADTYGVPLVPFILLNVIGNPDMMQRDRVHPSASGARAIADNIWPYLKAILEHAA